MAQLQQAALPEIKRMMQLNPLSNYAAWQPREIAGTNPFYEQLFGTASQLGPANQGLNLIFGEPPAPTGGAPAPSSGGGMTFMGSDVGSGSGAPTGGVPAPPAQFQPMDIQSIVQQAIAAQTQSALNPNPNAGYISFDTQGGQHFVHDSDYHPDLGQYLDPVSGEYFTNAQKIG